MKPLIQGHTQNYTRIHATNFAVSYMFQSLHVGASQHMWMKSRSIIRLTFENIIISVFQMSAVIFVWVFLSKNIRLQQMVTLRYGLPIPDGIWVQLGLLPDPQAR